MRRLVIVALSALCLAWMARLGMMGSRVPLFSVSYTNSGATLLPSALTINGTALTLVLSYYGTDATGGESATWPAHDGAGPTLGKLESGTAVTAGVASPGLDGGTAVQNNSGDYYTAGADTASGDIDTGDFAIEIVAMATAANQRVFQKRTIGGGSEGWDIYSGADGWHLYLKDAGARTADASCASGLNVWAHCLWLVDRSVNSTDGSKPYFNGAAQTGANPSTITTLTNANPVYMGIASGGIVLYARMWKCPVGTPACLANADLTEENAIAKDRAAKVMGIYPAIATGSYTPTTMTRASTAYLRKVIGGVSTLYPVGSNWMRVGQDNIGAYWATDALQSAGRGNLLLQSDDVATSWTKIDAGDTQSLNDAAAADPLQDGATTADCLISDADDGDHGFSQAPTLFAAIYTYSIFAKPGDRNWIYLSDDTVANATSYFNISTCAVGTKGAGVIDQFVDDYGDFCRVAISFSATAAPHTLKWLAADTDNDKTVTGDASTQNTCVWGAQVTWYPFPLSYKPTTTATANGVQDDLVYAATGNTNTAAGSLVVTSWTPAHDYPSIGVGGIVEIGDANNDFLTLRHKVSNDAGECYVRSNGADQATVAGSVDIADGASHVASCQWTTNYATITVDGTTASPDTSVTVPVDFTGVYIGRNVGEYQPSRIQSVKIYGVSGVTQ